jgi:hypothetical protein
MADDCNHATIKRCKDPYEKEFADAWVCEDCGVDFLPEYTAQDALRQIEEESDNVIDMATGMFSAVLWDLTQRVREEGIVQADPERVPNMRDYKAQKCEDEGHLPPGADGRCPRCRKSPFFGVNDG